MIALLLSIGMIYVLMNEPLPVGTAGKAAEDLANRMLDAVNHDAWEQTGAIEWNFDNRQQHVWDRQRHYAQVSWDEYLVQIDINRRKGVVIRGSEAQNSQESSKICHKAWKMWVNDSFWLNPISKVKDPGTARSIVSYEGKDALLITYNNGGVTPGDSYLWLLDDEDLPYQWKMWVSIIPIGGISTTWEGWNILQTGARVSSIHKNLLTLKLLDIKADKSIQGLKGNDIFVPLTNNESLLVDF